MLAILLMILPIFLLALNTCSEEGGREGGRKRETAS